jgi:hypothetical protein
MRAFDKESSPWTRVRGIRAQNRSMLRAADRRHHRPRGHHKAPGSNSNWIRKGGKVKEGLDYILLNMEPKVMSPGIQISAEKPENPCDMYAEWDGAKVVPLGYRSTMNDGFMRSLYLSEILAHWTDAAECVGAKSWRPTGAGYRRRCAYAVLFSRSFTLS